MLTAESLKHRKYQIYIIRKIFAAGQLPQNKSGEGVRQKVSTQYVSAREALRQAEFIEENRELLGSGKLFHIMTFGCQLNDNDSEKLAGLLEAMGMEKTELAERADLILINTCSVRENAAGRFFGNLGIIKNMKRDKPDMLVGVCGCMMKQEVHVDRIRRSYPFVDLLFGPQDIYRFPELLNRRLQGTRRVYDVGEADVVAEGVPIRRERKYRALCTIMYGCNNFCSYCIVPYARGRERSRRQPEVIAELKALADEGYSEVMLLGQNVNSYGKDLPQSEEQGDFVDLLTEAAMKSGLKRIRFMTSHPKDVSPALIDTMARFPNIERHLHLAVQSGSDRILKAMNRKYTAEHFLSLVHEARTKIPGISISTDIIVGYPGESEEDFKATLDLVREAAFDQAFMFQYSPRPGTPAAKLEEIPAEVMTDRFNRLVELQNENSLRSYQALLNTEQEVLIEGLSDHAGTFFTGRDSASHLINFSVPEEVFSELGLEEASWSERGEALEGRFAKVRVTEAKTFSSQGELTLLMPEEGM